MIIAKHSNGSSLPHLPKRRFQSWIKSCIPVLILSSFLGTYLDLIMVGQKLYAFPLRPFPKIFSFNLLFTLVGLPIGILIFLLLIKKRGRWARTGIIVLFSMGMAVCEKKSEAFGMFVYSHSWSHLYTFAGYCLFLSIVKWFHIWITTTSGEY